MASGETISMIVDASDEDAATKGLFGRKKPERREMAVALIRENLSQESAKLLEILDAVPATQGWHLGQVEVGIDITVEGGVSFIGTANVAAAASLKLQFTRAVKAG